ncbi:MAG: Lrp/AsnC ligand binding domain-containing protein [Chloroflexi bacterium]|nr:Lrp/AsnC ligand binding domain-containing protein [Chloroflexota bacterium]
MSICSFILIEAEPGKVRAVADKIASVPGVLKAYGVTGPYDVIAMLEGESIEDLGKIVTTEIQILPGVRKTVTCLCTFSCPQEVQ